MHRSIHDCLPKDFSRELEQRRRSYAMSALGPGKCITYLLTYLLT